MLDVYRRELKYLVTLEEKMRIKQRLEMVMRADPHNGDDGYLVRSLYFDNLFDTDFEDKVDGYDKRQKIRLRVYNLNSETAKLELKEKDGDSQRKRSLIVSREEARQMMQGNYSFLMERPEPMAHWLYTFMTTRSYRPKCIVEYDRLAYYKEDNDTRITFDGNLRATEANFDLFCESLILYPVSSPAEVTMEVKYNGFLYSYIKNIVSKTGKMQISNSKYCRARKITKKGRK